MRDLRPYLRLVEAGRAYCEDYAACLIGDTLDRLPEFVLIPALAVALRLNQHLPKKDQA